MQINYSGLTLLPSELTGEFTAASPELPKDRKSTRLNSSHSQISYAVFCLKKKRAEIEDVVVRPAVDLDVVEPIVLPRHGPTHDLRRGAHEVGERAVQRRHVLDGAVARGRR